MSFLFDMFSGGRPSVPTHVPSPEQPRSLVLYQYRSCPYCRRVLNLLESIDFEVELRDTLQERGRREELRSRTGRTQVPCMFIDDVPLFESADIVAWLEAYATQGARAA